MIGRNSEVTPALLSSMPHRTNVGPRLLVAALLLGALLIGALIGTSTPAGVIGGIGLLGLIFIAAVVIVAPRAIYRMTAFILSGLPFMVIPGVPLPGVLALALLTWCTIITHRVAEKRVGAMEVAVFILALTSLVSMMAMATGARDLMEFVKWIVATSVVFALLRLDPPNLRLFGRWFVYGTVFGSLFGLAMYGFDRGGTMLSALAPIGYGQTGTIGTHLRFFTTDGVKAVRLTGTYIDPNVAGIYLFVGITLAVALFRGWQRLIFTVVILAALITTLSRSAIFSAVVAVILLLLFQRMRTGLRLGVVGAMVVAGAVALSVPAIHARVFSSFSSQDKGTDDRARALADYTTVMRGHWLFGKGWGIPEFTNEVVGYKTNYVANSPLLTIYRGGVFTGAAFVLILLIGAYIAFTRFRSPAWEAGVVGAAFIGFEIVALQLDFPVVTQAPITMAFSVLIVFACCPASLFTTASIRSGQPPGDPNDRPITGNREEDLTHV